MVRRVFLINVNYAEYCTSMAKTRLSRRYSPVDVVRATMDFFHGIEVHDESTCRLLSFCVHGFIKRIEMQTTSYKRLSD